MKWYKLKQNKCPGCGKDFDNFTDTHVKCQCGFTISIKRLGEIVNSQNSSSISKIQQVEDNQQALSDL